MNIDKNMVLLALGGVGAGFGIRALKQRHDAAKAEKEVAALTAKILPSQAPTNPAMADALSQAIGGGLDLVRLAQEQGKAAGHDTRGLDQFFAAMKQQGA